MLKKFFAIFLLAGTLVSSVPFAARADEGLLVAPAVLDRKAKARDILNETLVVANTSDHAQRLYPVVQNVTVANGERSFTDPSVADLQTSLANWIFFTRGLIELQPGERRSLDLRIEVNLNAKPGSYHALISFPAGNTRAEAEGVARNAPGLTVNLEVLNDAREILQLKDFTTANNFFLRAPVDFSYTIQNIGNRSLTPHGSVIFYDSTGREIGQAAVNSKEESIEAGGAKRFAGTWQPAAFRFGHYKAFLDLQYGSDGTAQMQDTIFFWVVPWYILLLIISMMAGLGFFVASIIHRRYTRWHHARLRSLAVSHQDLARRLAAVPPPMPPMLRPATQFASRHFAPFVPARAADPAPLPPPSVPSPIFDTQVPTRPPTMDIRLAVAEPIERILARPAAPPKPPTRPCAMDIVRSRIAPDARPTPPPRTVALGFAPTRVVDLQHPYLS